MNKKGFALTQININQADNETLAHEFAHHFLGDTSGTMNRISGKDPTGIFGLVSNTFADVANDLARDALKGPRMGHGMSPMGMGPLTDLGAAFNSGAKQFQDSITPRQ